MMKGSVLVTISVGKDLGKINFLPSEIVKKRTSCLQEL